MPALTPALMLALVLVPAARSKIGGGMITCRGVAASDSVPLLESVDGGRGRPCKLVRSSVSTVSPAGLRVEAAEPAGLADNSSI